MNLISQIVSYLFPTENEKINIDQPIHQPLGSAQYIPRDGLEYKYTPAIIVQDKKEEKVVCTKRRTY